MRIDRTELANALAEATGWSVTADSHRVTFTNDDPPQVVIWTVTDSELGLAHRNTTAGIAKFHDHYQLIDVLKDCG
ncbi:hypothetical protein [Brevibacterium sediminis]|uniref:hypothetical protein n=1 Tax=Brevibacterium sediminis TaxID=1857024 RepID=UPI003671A0DA